jgi:beta-lactamase class A
MNRSTALLLLAIAGAAPLAAQPHAPAPRTDPALAATLDSLAHGFRGRVGIYVRHLPSGAGYQRDADSVFPTASLIKIPLLLTLYDQVERGAHDLQSRLPYPDTLTYRWTEATDVVGYMAPGDTLPLRELAFLMLTVSDNHASLWIQALLGGGTEVNRWLEANGYRETRVNSRTPGREEARSRHGWGQTTPREIAEALVSIREGRAVSASASEAMYRMLSGSYWNAEALSQVPPTVQAASKQGFVDRSRSEVLLVNSPGGDYVLAVVTAEQEDTSHTAENEGHRLIRAVSRAVYERYNPGDEWRPAPNR